MTEGDDGTVNAMFTVSLNLISSQAISVQYQTVDGTATAADSDYVVVSPTSLTFNPGESSKTISIAVKGDTKVEPNETFSINLTQPLNAVVTKATGTATIINNDKQTTPPKVITPPKVVPSVETPPGGITPETPKPTSNQVIGTAGNDNLGGTSRADVLVGNDGNDIIRGLDGDDLIFGSNGNDQLFGGGGNDVIYGRDGKDKLFGDAGDDILIGGFRNDVITGGTGKDRFEFRGLQQGIDRITDFSVVDDTFALLKQNFKSGLKVGILTNDQFRLGAKALDKGDRFIYNAQTGGLFFDIDGSGGSKQVQLAHLTKGLALTRQDCVVT